ncbi:MAG: hypothetical protein AAB738_01260 [Patescibacteria group bacterium]
MKRAKQIVAAAEFWRVVTISAIVSIVVLIGVAKGPEGMLPAKMGYTFILLGLLSIAGIIFGFTNFLRNHEEKVALRKIRGVKRFDKFQELSQAFWAEEVGATGAGGK